MFVDEIVSDGVFAGTDTCNVVNESSYAGIRDSCQVTSADANQHGGSIFRSR